MSLCVRPRPSQYLKAIFECTPFPPPLNHSRSRGDAECIYFKSSSDVTRRSAVTFVNIFNPVASVYCSFVLYEQTV